MIDPLLVKLPEYPFANIKFLRVIFEPAIVNILIVLFAWFTFKVCPFPFIVKLFLVIVIPSKSDVPLYL